MTHPPGWLGTRGTPLSAVGEFGLIARLRAVIEGGEPTESSGGSFIAQGIGDDTAILTPRFGWQILATCDVQVEGRHFQRAWMTPRELGLRAAQINLSDIAAMGGLPRAALVSLLMDDTVKVEDIEEIYRGLLEGLREHGATIAGGNVSAVASGLQIDVTLLGEVEAERVLRRDGAAKGDILWVTGAPGSAAAGYQLLQTLGPKRIGEDLQAVVDAYLAPAARVREARALGASGAVSAMIDVSDGLAGDLRHLVEGREIDALLREESLPIADDLMRAARSLGRTAESILLGPSDDYELLFTTPAKKAEEAMRALREVSDIPAWPIGEIVAGHGAVDLEDRDGARKPLGGSGWDHFGRG